MTVPLKSSGIVESAYLFQHIFFFFMRFIFRKYIKNILSFIANTVIGITLSLSRRIFDLRKKNQFPNHLSIHYRMGNKPSHATVPLKTNLTMSTRTDKSKNFNKRKCLCWKRKCLFRCLFFCVLTIRKLSFYRAYSEKINEMWWWDIYCIVYGFRQ